MRIVILGSGRVGSRLANALVDKGHTIIVIDEMERKFKALDEHFDIHRIEGNIFDDETSDRAFSEMADVFIVVTGKDNVNVMAAQAIQKKYQIKKILIRIFDPDLADVYRMLGFE
ncbi:MAG: TrkA family potassium uptake protein, partial [Nitrospirae bacterium]|nr:TrkA family potassium uptake protein [Candidatus Troglogloeales bacterium]